jgi:hypothetical protein
MMLLRVHGAGACGGASLPLATLRVLNGENTPRSRRYTHVRRRCTPGPIKPRSPRRTPHRRAATPPDGTGGFAVASAPAAAPRTSLIPETLLEMESDGELQATLAALAQKGQAALTREERVARQRSLAGLGAPSFTRVCQVRRPARTPCATPAGRGCCCCGLTLCNAGGCGTPRDGPPWHAPALCYPHSNLIANAPPNTRWPHRAPGQRRRAAVAVAGAHPAAQRRAVLQPGTHS